MGELMNLPSPGAVGSGASYGDFGAPLSGGVGGIGSDYAASAKSPAASSIADIGFSKGSVAAGASYAGGGLKAFSDVMEGYATKAADEFKSKRLEESAQYGHVAAQQTGAQLTENLNMVLGNISAVRAAAGTDPTSATGAALRARQEYVGVRDRDIRMANLEAQARRDEEESAYLKKAGQYAIKMGLVKGAASLTTSIAKGMAA